MSCYTNHREILAAVVKAVTPYCFGHTLSDHSSDQVLKKDILFVPFSEEVIKRKEKKSLIRNTLVMGESPGVNSPSFPKKFRTPEKDITDTEIVHRSKAQRPTGKCQNKQKRMSGQDAKCMRITNRKQ